MTACLGLLHALSDAESVLACYGGAAWRDAALLGLGTVLLIGGVAWFVAVGLRRWV